MQISPLKFLTCSVLLVTILSTSGCTPQMRKARYSEQGERYFKAGEYDKAKIEYLNVLKVDQRDANAFSRLGAMWLEEGAPLRAGGFLVKAIELAPNNIDNHLKLARVYLAMGSAADARKEAMTVLEKAPDNGDALLILVDAVRKNDDLAVTDEQLQKFPKKDSVYYHLATAGVAAKKGDLSAAEVALQHALAADPKFPAVHSALGTLALARKDVSGATTEFQQAADLSPLRSNERI